MTDSENLAIAEKMLQDAVRAMDRHATENEGAAACLKFKGWDVQASREWLTARAIERMK